MISDLNLRVEHGESVSLPGSNRSEKSTALCMIGGVYAPTEGTIFTSERLAAVIEIGVGFHPELTGAENVALYAAVMGLDGREIAQRCLEVVAFADVGKLIHEPVQYYFSGMQARLAFVVAVCVQPDVLLLDEVPAVGDQSFRDGCLAHLRRYHREGGTLIVMSREHETVRTLCTRGVWLHEGAGATRRCLAGGDVGIRGEPPVTVLR